MPNFMNVKHSFYESFQVLNLFTMHFKGHSTLVANLYYVISYNTFSKKMYFILFSY